MVVGLNDPVVVVYTARLAEGRGVKVYRDLEFQLLRHTRVSARKAFLWGRL